jgi:hypothetical protein
MQKHIFGSPTIYDFTLNSDTTMADTADRVRIVDADRATHHDGQAK